MEATLVVEAMRPGDWDEVRAIYEQGIRTGDATFETSPPSWDEWDATHLAHCRLVARMDGRIVGWGALSPTSDRCAYSGVAEASVYVAEDARGRGVGGRVLGALILDSEREDIWTLQAGVFPENEGSLALFQRRGFRIVGKRERLGELHGRWRDVLLLERRSRVAGR